MFEKRWHNPTYFGACKVERRRLVTHRDSGEPLYYVVTIQRANVGLLPENTDLEKWAIRDREFAACCRALADPNYKPASHG